MARPAVECACHAMREFEVSAMHKQKAKTISALRETTCPTILGWYLIMNSSTGCLISPRQLKKLYKSSLHQVLLSTSLALLGFVNWVSLISLKLQKIICCLNLLVLTQNQVLFRTSRLSVICKLFASENNAYFFIHYGALVKPGFRKRH